MVMRPFCRAPGSPSTAARRRPIDAPPGARYHTAARRAGGPVARRLRALAVVLVVSCGALMASSTAGSGNLLSGLDSGFEAGSEGWAVSNGTLSTASVPPQQSNQYARVVGGS